MTRKRLISYGILLLLATLSSYNNCMAQNALSINGIKISSDDSLKARRILKTEIPPSSSFWAKKENQPGHYNVTKFFTAIGRIAYPTDSPLFKTAYTDSVMEYINKVNKKNANKDVRAEFLRMGLNISHGFGFEKQSQHYYSMLTTTYPNSYYAKHLNSFARNRSIKIGNQIPNFKVPILADTTKSYTKANILGKIVLIDFWGTWCGPCRKEMPYLTKAYKKYRNKGFTILSIAMNDNYKAVNNFRANQWSMPWFNSFIPNNSTLESKIKSGFDIIGFPQNILIDKKGEIIATGLKVRGKNLLKTLKQHFK